MDFKKFGRVVLILGVVILLYGGFQLVSNQEPKREPSRSITDLRPEPDYKLSVNRDDAIKILIAGGIVAFVGLGISYSAKKKE